MKPIIKPNMNPKIILNQISHNKNIIKQIYKVGVKIKFNKINLIWYKLNKYKLIMTNKNNRFMVLKMKIQKL